jgi:glycosyltransferase involved in cell wall biosynthesis
MRRRVLILPSAYPSDQAPIEGVFVEDQARVLSEACEVRLLVQRPFGWRHVVSGRMPPPSSLGTRNGVSVYEQRVPVPPGLSRRSAMAWQLTAARRAVARAIRVWGKPAVLHAHVVLPAGWIAAHLGREFDIPVMLTEHTGPFSTHLASREQCALVREAFAGTGWVAAVSPMLAQQIRAFAPGMRVEVVGNVVLTRFFTPSEQPDDTRPAARPLRLFSAALLNESKGYEHLLHAARLLVGAGFVDFELQIGGDGPDRDRLQRLIGELNLGQHCRLLGMLSREELRMQMQRCDIFILPSLAETFGLVIGEAMACGKPVLATRCGGPESQVTPETGVLVTPGDAQVLATALTDMAGRLRDYSPARIRAVVVERFGESAFLRSVGMVYDALGRTPRASPVPREVP